jgi:hypothetical protein
VAGRINVAASKVKDPIIAAVTNVSVAVRHWAVANNANIPMKCHDLMLRSMKSIARYNKSGTHGTNIRKR